MRLILDGKHYDLSVAFGDATLSDWKAFISGTFAHEGKARGTADVQRGIEAMQAASRRIRAAGNGAEQTAEEELQFFTTVTDLLFLARRKTERRLTYAEVADGVKYSDIIDGIVAGANTDDGSADVEPDPTTA